MHLRAWARSLRGGLTAEDRFTLSESIMGHLLAWPVFDRAQSIMAYVSVGSEVETPKLLDAILSAGKRLYLPRCGDGRINNGRISDDRTDNDHIDDDHIGDGRTSNDRISDGRIDYDRASEKHVMEAVEVFDLSRLIPGRFGIPEPDASHKAARKHEIDLILVPGLLFDSSGARLGQGGGYYDRFLSDYQGITCGLAFSIQIVPRLAQQPHDVCVQALATEHNIT